MHGLTQLDRENAFLLYATFCGDVERTAHALGLRAVDVLRVVEEEGWTERLRPILELKKSTRPGDIERAINRALNFAQCHRFRLFLERVLNKIVGFSPEELEEYLLSERGVKDGPPLKRLTTRALADLASAMEKCQAMSYLALTDTVQDRSKRKEAEEHGEAGGELHARIAEAMAKVGSSKTPRAQLLDAQIEYAENVSKHEAIKTPYDKD